MKDYGNLMEDPARPTQSPAECIEFCLRQLQQDKSHSLSDLVVKGLTFEELIGSLMAARDIVSTVDVDGLEKDIVDEEEEIDAEALAEDEELEDDESEPEEEPEDKEPA